eukprot:gene17237-biopygen12354
MHGITSRYLSDSPDRMIHLKSRPAPRLPRFPTKKPGITFPWEPNRVPVGHLRQGIRGKGGRPSTGAQQGIQVYLGRTCNTFTNDHRVYVGMSWGFPRVPGRRQSFERRCHPSDPPAAAAAAAAEALPRQQQHHFAETIHGVCFPGERRGKAGRTSRGLCLPDPALSLLLSDVLCVRRDDVWLTDRVSALLLRARLLSSAMVVGSRRPARPLSTLWGSKLTIYFHAPGRRGVNSDEPHGVPCIAEQCTERRAQVGRELVASGVDQLVGERQVVVRQRRRDPLRCHRRRRDARLLMVHPVDEAARDGEVDDKDATREDPLERHGTRRVDDGVALHPPRVAPWRQLGF